MVAQHTDMLPHLVLDVLAVPYARVRVAIIMAGHVQHHRLLGDRQACNRTVAKSLRLPYGIVRITHRGESRAVSVNKSFKQ